MKNLLTPERMMATTKTPEEISEWPEGISNGLCLPCGVCGEHTDYDYTVHDAFWARIVPAELQLGVVCLSCLDELALDCGDTLAGNLTKVQFTGCTGTIVLRPTEAHVRL